MLTRTKVQVGVILVLMMIAILVSCIVLNAINHSQDSPTVGSGEAERSVTTQSPKEGMSATDKRIGVIFILLMMIAWGLYGISLVVDSEGTSITRA
ncbi:hypothetical protein HOA55_04635 [archaeon]|nr:hypothetical protein [archaeon]MBT6820616.1 hypothetical protein [archaeon]MBT7024974.1 hypothetical protein [archaeon]MBT7238593.1 hypothetical protein [archaeon]MBT7912423.1 hypothetical protein [Candidatus Bathyarchaeota archaeon]